MISCASLWEQEELVRGASHTVEHTKDRHKGSLQNPQHHTAPYIFSYVDQPGKILKHHFILTYDDISLAVLHVCL